MLEIVAAQGGNLGSHTPRLNQLLQRFTPAELGQAIAIALERQTTHLGAIRQLLDKARADRDRPPPVRLPLRGDPRLDSLVVTPHPLASYDTLRKDKPDDPAQD